MDILFAIAGFLITILLILLVSVIEHRYDFFKTLYSVLKPIRFIVVILVLGYFFFLNSSQGQDFFISYQDDYWDDTNNESKYFFSWLAKHSRFIGFAFWLIIWSLATWYSCRMVLYLSEIKPIEKLKQYKPATEKFIDFFKKIINKKNTIKPDNIKVVTQQKNLEIEKIILSDKQQTYIKISPRILGGLPFLIAIIAFLFTTCFWYTFTLFILLIFYFIFSFNRNCLLNLNLAETYKLEKHNINKLPVSSILIIIIAAITTVMFFIIFTFTTSIAQWLTPPVIVLIAFSTWTVIGMMIIWLENEYKFPIFLCLIGFIVIFSYWNDNHKIRTIDKPEISFVKDTKYFEKWVDSLKIDSNTKEYPVYLIASAGGGSRSAYWTMAVLSEIQKRNKDFYRHIFAMSGVSGGSLGLGIFGAKNQQAIREKNPTILKDSIMKEIAGKDYLSPLLSAFFYNNFLQWMLPFPIQSFDRARWLEDAWGNAYKELEYPIQKIFPLDGKSPMILFNATHLETGKKSITSNVILDTHFYHDIFNVCSIVNKPIPLKTAVSISARFPYITPPATIYHNKKKWGHLIDGGYLENSGLMTIVQTLQMMQFIIKKHENMPDAVIYNKIKPFIIFIENSNFAVDTTKLPVNRLSYETTTPIKGFYNAWGGESVPLLKDIERRKFDFKQGVKYISLALSYDKKDGKYIKIPLGWYLSPTAKKYMDEKAKDVINKNWKK